MEAETMLAITIEPGVILLILGGIFVIAALAALALHGRTKERMADIPRGMRPGPSDPALETPLLQKAMGWGVILVAFFALWVPFIWLQEPNANLRQEEELTTQSIDRGHRSVLPFSEENQLGVGCTRCHGPELRGSTIAVGSAFDYPPNLTNICAGPFGEPAHPLIKSIDDIRDTIMQGRGNMPSWSIRYQGALDDQQIGDLVNYLVNMSSENVPFEDNVCLNPEAAARAEQG
jgi:mono/diheme cytochrome c family protein